MTALWGNQASAIKTSSKNLLEFKAGKMHMKGTMVNPDKRKGLLYLYQGEDSLMHLCWKDRLSGNIEDDLIIFPDDCEFKRVAECTTGRVYILKFKTSSRKYFFWMQNPSIKEPKDDEDVDNCKKVNDYLNNPPSPGSTRGTSSARPDPLMLGHGGQMLDSIPQDQLMNLLGMGGNQITQEGLSALSSLLSNSSPAPIQTTDPAPQTPSQEEATVVTVANNMATPDRGTRPQLQLSDLQNVLSVLPQPKEKADVDLTSELTATLLAPILAKPEVRERLTPLLPEGENLAVTDRNLEENISSEQFKQTVKLFQSALRSGQLAPVIGQFGVGERACAAATAGDLEAFVAALEDEENEKQGPATMEVDK